LRSRFAVPAALFLLAISMLPFALRTTDAASRPARVKTWTWTFQADTLGQEPQHTGLSTGRWEVALVESPPGTPAAGNFAADSTKPESTAVPRVLRQAETDDGIEFHYLQFRKPVIEDLSASVRFRVLSGEIDPTAGLLFQLDPKGKNGYLLRVSGEKNRLVAHYLLQGKRRDLEHVEVPPLEPGTWHTLSVTRKGSVMTASYDGVERFRLRDERFRRGTVGLWTEDDTVVEFADLTVSTN
jgi:hypothetical protein